MAHLTELLQVLHLVLLAVTDLPITGRHRERLQDIRRKDTGLRKDFRPKGTGRLRDMEARQFPAEECLATTRRQQARHRRTDI